MAVGVLLHRDDARLLHFQPQIVALAGALAHAGKDGEAAVIEGHVVDELHDQDRLAHARAAEQSRFAALGVGLQQVHHLDARLEHHGIGGLLLQRGRMAMDGKVYVGGDGPQVVHGAAQHIDDASQGAFPHGDGDGTAHGDGGHAPLHPVRGLKGHAAHHAVAQLLGHLDGDVNRHPLSGERRLDFHGVVDLRDRGGIEGHVQNGPHDADDFAFSRHIQLLLKLDGSLKSKVSGLKFLFSPQDFRLET